jgi:hypothetical protein
MKISRPTLFEQEQHTMLKLPLDLNWAVRADGRVIAAFLAIDPALTFATERSRALPAATYEVVDAMDGHVWKTLRAGESA